MRKFLVSLVTLVALASPALSAPIPTPAPLPESNQNPNSATSNAVSNANFNALQTSIINLTEAVNAGGGGGGGGVTAVTGSGNVLSSGGVTPNITTVISPSFSGVTVTGIAANQCVQTNGSSKLVGTGSVCGGGGGGSPSFIPIQSDGYGNNFSQDRPFFISHNSLPLGFVATIIAENCEPYNAADATAGSNGTLYTPLDASGLTGGMINIGIVNDTHSVTAPLIIGSVTLPTSPQAGPYVSSATAVIGSPYTLGPNDFLTFSISGTTATTNPLQNCTLEIGN